MECEIKSTQLIDNNEQFLFAHEDQKEIVSLPELVKNYTENNQYAFKDFAIYTKVHNRFIAKGTVAEQQDIPNLLEGHTVFLVVAYKKVKELFSRYALFLGAAKILETERLKDILTNNKDRGDRWQHNIKLSHDKLSPQKGGSPQSPPLSASREKMSPLRTSQERVGKENRFPRSPRAGNESTDDEKLSPVAFLYADRVESDNLKERFIVGRRGIENSNPQHSSSSCNDSEDEISTDLSADSLPVPPAHPSSSNATTELIPDVSPLKKSHLPTLPTVHHTQQQKMPQKSQINSDQTSSENASDEKYHHKKEQFFIVNEKTSASTPLKRPSYSSCEEGEDESSTDLSADSSPVPSTTPLPSPHATTNTLPYVAPLKKSHSPTTSVVQHTQQHAQSEKSPLDSDQTGSESTSDENQHQAEEPFVVSERTSASTPLKQPSSSSSDDTSADGQLPTKASLLQSSPDKSSPDATEETAQAPLSPTTQSRLPVVTISRWLAPTPEMVKIIKEDKWRPV